MKQPQMLWPGKATTHNYDSSISSHTDSGVPVNFTKINTNWYSYRKFNLKNNNLEINILTVLYLETGNYKIYNSNFN
jgi:hypothetical protein